MSDINGYSVSVCVVQAAAGPSRQAVKIKRRQDEKMAFSQSPLCGRSFKAIPG